MEKNNQLADPTSAIDGKHIYINSAANNTLDGSETFQGDVNFNNHRIKKYYSCFLKIYKLINLLDLNHKSIFFYLKKYSNLFSLS